MAGRWSRSARPKRPGAYFNFVAAEAEPILANTLGVVVVPFTHSWGPSEQIVELGSFGDFLTIFGRGVTAQQSSNGVYTPGYQAVFDAFRGEGLPGKGGAGKVLAYRQVGASAAKASKALQNTTPATAITLEAIYDGDYGEQLSVTVVTNALDGTKRDLTIYVEGVEAETFTYTSTDIDDLAARINGTGAHVGTGGSDWVRTTGAVVSGTALAAVASPSSFTGGDDGTTLLAADWTALMSAAEPYRFSLFAAQNLTDSSILASLKTWAVALNEGGKRFMTVVGGGATGTPDTVSDAITRSGTLNDPNFVNLGGGVYDDGRFGELHPSQLVSRLAGILAARGESMSITFARLADLSITTGVTESEILQALDSGVVVISRDSHPSAPTRFEKGLTTFTDADDPDRPLEIYSVPKFVRTMGNLETELTEFAEMRVIGQMAVTPGTRDYLRGQMEARLQAREEAGVIQPGWFVQISQDPAPSDEDDFIALDYSIKFGRSLEQVLNTVTIG
jgi:hypothetical protein